MTLVCPLELHREYRELVFASCALTYTQVLVQTHTHTHTQKYRTNVNFLIDYTVRNKIQRYIYICAEIYSYKYECNELSQKIDSKEIKQK